MSQLVPIIWRPFRDKTFRKIIVFADEEAASSFAGGESWYSKLKENFNIEVIIIDIPETLRSSLLAAQKPEHSIIAYLLIRSILNLCQSVLLAVKPNQIKLISYKSRESFQRIIILQGGSISR